MNSNEAEANKKLLSNYLLYTFMIRQIIDFQIRVNFLYVIDDSIVSYFLF